MTTDQFGIRQISWWNEILSCTFSDHAVVFICESMLVWTCCLDSTQATHYITIFN